MAESIELQIKSDAQQAIKAIGNLQSKLQGLGDTLNSLNGASISNFASGMSHLATSLRSVSSIDTRTFSKIATNMEKLGNLDTARLVSSASALKSMATELSGFANISKQSAEITQLTASISKLGSKSAGYAADNIRNLGGGSGSGGSGGGGAGGGVDSSLKKTDGLIEKYKSSIKDLYSLGKYIGDALASAMESIDWKKIYQKADNFGKGLADFLNGLISPRLFYDLGATIAGSLNTALHFLNSFGTTFDWTNFGLSIANGINGFFENFDFALLAKTINAWLYFVRAKRNCIRQKP